MLLLGCSIPIAACHREGRVRHAPYNTNDNDNENEDVAEAPPSESNGCNASCAHYLQCKNLTDRGSYDACVMQCARMHYSETNLASYAQTDCATAITIVEGSPQQQQQQQRAPQQKSSECNGCVWDGSSCVWVSQSNWGTGPNSPYSGAVSSCNAYCCGH